MTTTTSPPDKMSVLIELLKDAWVYVRLDPRRDGVALPEWLRNQPDLVLQYGYNMPIPIQDFVVDDKGIGATLSFQKKPYSTFVPWSAIFMISDGEKRGMIWEADVPQELLKAAAGATAAEQSSEAKPAPEKPAEPAPAEPAAAPTKPGKRPRPSYLKLVD